VILVACRSAASRALACSSLSMVAINGVGVKIQSSSDHNNNCKLLLCFRQVGARVYWSCSGIASHRTTFAGLGGRECAFLRGSSMIELFR
jgi:hypothetical protein